MKTIEQLKYLISQLSKEELLLMVEHGIFPQLTREELIAIAQLALNMAQKKQSPAASLIGSLSEEDANEMIDIINEDLNKID